MSPPIAEGSHRPPVLIEANIEIGHEDHGEVLLSADTVEGTTQLQDIIADNPKSIVLFRDEGSGELTVEGVPMDEYDIDTTKARVLNPSTEPVAG